MRRTVGFVGVGGQSDPRSPCLHRGGRQTSSTRRRPVRGRCRCRELRVVAAAVGLSIRRPRPPPDGTPSPPPRTGGCIWRGLAAGGGVASAAPRPPRPPSGCASLPTPRSSSRTPSLPRRHPCPHSVRAAPPYCDGSPWGWVASAHRRVEGPAEGCAGVGHHLRVERAHRTAAPRRCRCRPTTGAAAGAAISRRSWEASLTPTLIAGDPERMPVAECRSETYPPSLFPAAGPVARSTPSRPTDERLGWVSPPSFAGARPRDPGGARSLGASSEVVRKKNPGEISVAWADSRLARGAGSVQRFSVRFPWSCTFRSRGARWRRCRPSPSPIVAPRTASRAVAHGRRVARGGVARWGPGGRAFSFPVDAPGGGASTSPAPPAVPPPRGEDPPPPLQAADSWRDVLAASTLVVLPDEESVAWRRQRIHRKRRAGGAARALGRIARWLAAL